MELRHLRYFVAVAEEENFRRAAVKLHVSQSPLSRQMQQLRDELGVELFEAAGRGVKLTLPGRIFLERAVSILSTVEAAVQEAREARDGNIGTIAIGFEPGSAYLGSLSTIVAKLRKRQPRVRVKLLPMTSTEQWDALRLGEIALGYGNYAPDDASLRSVVLARTRIGILLPRDHRLAKQSKLKVADLANEPMLMDPRRMHPRLHDDIMAAVRAHGVVLKPMPDIVDGEALWTLVSSGLGLSFAAEKPAGLFMSLGSAVWRPLSDLGMELRDIAMWQPDAERSALLQPLIEIVREVRTQLQRSATSRKRRERAK